MDEDVAEVVELRVEDKPAESEEAEKLILKDQEETNHTMVKSSHSVTKDKLVEIAVERIKEMEELKEDGLVVLEPQSSGDVVSVDEMAALDGINIVEFENKEN